MPKTPAALSADAFDDDAPASLREAALIDIDDVAQRRERLAAYAQATRAVIVYRFVFPEGATVASFGRGGEMRDAVAQLYAIVGLTGGGLAKSHGGLAARIPKILAAKFESLARALIETYLVSLELGEAA
ncbi:hypothetical protein [Caulobacter endophyticus]|uniref:Uncharacterized protein n=1 Tax=Caulobacter endophyticus TaxID=2172652 RepID=A0A2T9JIB9_9CAUL|nr:hypothetical protein [Caulobacter endophyticus]PVM83396.1 hypothetical protein DDF67_20885 [Caulobacter endophyticus]